MIGAHTDTSGAIAGCFNGTIDEVRVSSIVRYGRYRTPDASGTENDGFLKAAAAITDGGRFDRGLSLDGTDDYVEIPDDDTLDVTGDFTFEAWASGDSHRLCVFSDYPRSSHGVRVDRLGEWAGMPDGGAQAYADGGPIRWRGCGRYRLPGQRSPCP